jgi:valyl-tRNA synthetase
MFIKDLNMYSDWFIKEVKKYEFETSAKDQAYLNEFLANLMNGIHYYEELFPTMPFATEEARKKTIEELNFYKSKLVLFTHSYPHIFQPPQPVHTHAK